MALHDEVLHEILWGNLKQPFRVRDLKRRLLSESGCYAVGNQVYSENTLNTVLANQSIRQDGSEKGAAVQRGAIPRFCRHGTRPLQYSLLGHPDLALQADEESELVSSVCEVEEVICDKGTWRLDCDESAAKLIGGDIPSDPIEILVRAIAQHPFCRNFRRQRSSYPSVPAMGWEERLACYFWPDLDRNWEKNREQIDSYYKRFAELEDRLDTQSGASNLLVLFRDICGWGGVKLPERDPPRLALEVADALIALDGNEIPPKRCRLNSAWTKLYAIARPETFAIYDSRVATALTSILDPYMTSLSGTASFALYEELGFVNGRGGSRPRVLQYRWPNGYGHWPAQLAANRLCVEVRDRLNGDAALGGGHQWQLREVEAVLSMEGY